MAVGCGFWSLITLNPKPFSLMPRLGRFRRSRALEMSFGCPFKRVIGGCIAILWVLGPLGLLKAFS